MENDLQKRLFRFSVSIIKEVRNLPNSKEYRVISYQLLKSATAVGANYEEAQGAVSKQTFQIKSVLHLKKLEKRIIG